MKARHMITAIALQLVLLPALARDIYRWTDADGIEHFSETPPENPDVPVQTIRLEEQGGTNPGNLERVLDVAERLEASRLARERARAEAAREAREAKQETRQAEPSYPPPAPVYLYPPHRRHPVYPYPIPPIRKPVHPQEPKPPQGRVLPFEDNDSINPPARGGGGP